MSHALFSPSGAHRWAQCPGSLVLSKDMPNLSSESAKEGTMLHEVMQLLIEKKVKPEEVRAKYNLTDEQMAACLACKQRLNNIYYDYAQFEKSVSFGKAVNQPEKDARGTADVILVDELTETCHVVDYKFGRGYVNPMENIQGILYMIGAAALLKDYNFKNFKFEILQPRVGEDVSNGVYELTAAQLNDLAETMTKACNEVRKAFRYSDFNKYDRAKWNAAYLKPSESACEYCPASGTCPALQDIVARDVFEETRNLDEASMLADFPNLVDSGENELSDRLKQLPLIKLYVKELEAYALKKAMMGGKIQGFKLVEGRAGNREWLNSTDALNELSKHADKDMFISVPELLSPAKVQDKLAASGMTKAEAKNIVDTLTSRPDGKPTLVTEDKPGKEWNPPGNIITDLAIANYDLA